MTLGRAAFARGRWRPGRGGRCGFAHRRKCTESTSPRRAPIAAFATLPAPARPGSRASARRSRDARRTRRRARSSRDQRSSAPQRGAGAAALRRRSSAAPRPQRDAGGVVAELLQRVDRQRQRPAAQRRDVAARRPCPARRATPPRRRRLRQRQHVLRLAAAAGEQHLGLGDALLAPARPPRPRSAAGAGATAWQRLRIVGSKRVGRGGAEHEARRRRPALRASSAGRWRRSGSSARPDGARHLAAAARRRRLRQARSRRAPPRPGSPCSASSCRPCLRRPPPRPPRAQPRPSRSASGISTSRSGCECAAHQLAARAGAAGPLGQRHGRRLRTASPAPAPAPSSNWPTPPGPCSSSACAALRLERAAQRRGEPGQRRHAVGAGQPSSALAQRLRRRCSATVASGRARRRCARSARAPPSSARR